MVQRNNLGQFEKGCLPWNKKEDELEKISDKILLFLVFALIIIVFGFLLRLMTSEMNIMEFILFDINIIVFSICIILLVTHQETK